MEERGGAGNRLRLWTRRLHRRPGQEDRQGQLQGYIVHFHHFYLPQLCAVL